MNTRELMALRETKLAEARTMNEKAEVEIRDFTPEEQTAWEALQSEIKGLDNRIARSTIVGGTSQKPEKSPAVIGQLGEKPFIASLRSYLRDGDASGVQPFMRGEGVEFRASNATDMNIGTAADGGYIDPTEMYRGIIARRDQISLPTRLGVRRIPGKGTTVNVPLDAEADGEFVSTAEAGTFDLDSPALGQKALTLVKYSKRLPMSVELLEDEDASLQAFLTDWFARGLAKTLNSLLLTEVAANGGALKTFASVSAIAAGEPEVMVYNNDLAAYLDDTGSTAWVTRASTYGGILSVTGNPRQYAETVQGTREGPTLLGYPVYFSDKVAAPAATAKSIYFGNWNMVGWREAPGFTMLRDPYSAATTGQIYLWMYFRTVFGVLQSEAIGYGTQAASS